MPIIVNRGGPENEHVDLSSCAGGPDWEAVRTFLELARCGSIRSAADRMGLSPNALRRKIDDLERARRLREPPPVSLTDVRLRFTVEQESDVLR